MMLRLDVKKSEQLLTLSLAVIGIRDNIVLL